MFLHIETPSAVYGEKLRDQVEERLSFYETGEAPRKNIDIMREAMHEVRVFARGRILSAVCKSTCLKLLQLNRHNLTLAIMKQKGWLPGHCFMGNTLTKRGLTNA